MNDELSSLGSVRARGIALLVVASLAGGVAGGAIDRLWVARAEAGGEGWVAVRRQAEERRNGETVTRRGLTVYEPRRDEEIPAALRAVELTDAQRTRIRAIMSKYRPVADSLMRSVQPRVSELATKMNQEAMCVLTPRQREDWMDWRRREHLNLEEGSQLLKLATANACPRE